PFGGRGHSVAAEPASVGVHYRDDNAGRSPALSVSTLSSPRPPCFSSADRCNASRPRVTTRTCRRSPLRGAPRRLLASLFVFVVDFPDGFLHEPLHHRIQPDTALLRLRDTQHRLRRSAY